ncbi:glycoside hydrolase family 3 N-terminal domain-containing protein [Acuticoccus mangrovi]|uniref:beta-N-acetylhexosaminidase n=1 Tax=Acuticoccus mangrovi TaxID=2796142 RepID=A0A934MHA3_9HYPH|nr:hypothetical protein [Acuticoccus mangrovi]
MAVALSLATAGAAMAQARIPFPPIDGLIIRSDDYQPLPHPKPGLVATFAAGCIPTSPELAWAALPRSLREVPIEEMIGQLLVISFSGKTVKDPGVALAAREIADGSIGGVLYFRHNVGSAADVRAVNALFTDAHPDLPAMIAIDQEGGAVMRVKPSEGAPATPSARDIATTSPAEARGAYLAMADNLADLGFTTNFGPVVDLEVNPDNPVIARFGRAYGAEPKAVIAYAEAFIEAHHEAGIGTALKHFPGHGSSTADSHEGAIDLNATWSRREMVPFRELIRRHEVDMVMIGHLDLDGLSGPGGLPASLSPNAIDVFLRDTLCYGGLVVSDDLAMDAVSARWSPEEAALKMVEAGGDIALLSLSGKTGMAPVKEITRRLAAAAAADPKIADKIRYAYARVVHHKLDFAEKRRVSSRSRAPTPTQWAQVR